jgi:hypothetical protein
MHPHRARIQPRISTDLDIAYASADKVERTTRGIFLDTQVRGDRGASTLLAKLVSVAHTIAPWWDWRHFELAKEASPKDTKVMV